MTVQESYEDTIKHINRLIVICKANNRDYSDLLEAKEKAKKMYEDFLEKVQRP